MPVRERVARASRSSWLVHGLVQLPLLAAVLHAWRAGWVPIGDHGLIILRATDVFTSNHPLLGTWSSASLSTGSILSNPGPLLFDGLAPFVKLLGNRIGPVLGVGALNAVASVVALRQGRHLGGRRGELLAAVACLTVIWLLGSELLIDAWQPHMLVLPFLCFLICAAVVASGRVQSIAWLAGLASYLVQSHLSFIYLVAGVGGVALVACTLARRTAFVPDNGAAGVMRPALATAAVVFACWAQPLYEQFFGSGQGNLSRLAGATSSSADVVGFKLGAQLVARVVALPPWFLRPSFNESIPTAVTTADGSLTATSLPTTAVAALSLIVVLLATGLLLRKLRRGDALAFNLVLISGTALIAALITMTLMPIGPAGLGAHQMRWLWPISVLLWTSLGAGALWSLRSRWALLGHRSAIALGAAAVLCVLSLPSYDTDQGPASFRSYRSVISSMIDQLDDVDLQQPVLFDDSNLRFAEPFSGPMLLTLLDNDQPVTTDDEGFVRQLGEGRRASGDEQWLLQVLEGDPAIDLDPSMQVLAYADDLTVTEREQLVQLEGSDANPEQLEFLMNRRRAYAVAIVLAPRA